MRQVVEMQDGKAGIELAKVPNELLAAEPRHVAVGHDQVVGQIGAPCRRESGLTVPHSYHIIARQSEGSYQELPDGRLVIHNQDAGRARGHVSTEVSRCCECTRQFTSPLVGRLTAPGALLVIG
jgi:hypothetical protein